VEKTKSIGKVCPSARGTQVCVVSTDSPSEVALERTAGTINGSPPPSFCFKATQGSAGRG